MLKSTLEYVLPLCSAIESNIEDGDHATIAEQAAELVVAFQMLNTLLTLPTENHRNVIDCLDESIEALTASRKAIMSDVEKRIANGEDVAGFGFKSSAIKRDIPDYNVAVMALEALGIESNALFERKPLGVPSIEKLLKASGLKPEDRDAVLVQFVRATPGKPKLEKL